MKNCWRLVWNKLKNNGKYWVAFVGDSITSCEWVHPNWREMVEYVLKDKLEDEFEEWRIPSWGIRCFNFGYDGATTDDIVGLITNNQAISVPNNNQSPISNNQIRETIKNMDVVVLMMGLNDPTLKVEIKTHRNNIEKLIEEFGEKLVVSTDIYPNSEIEAKLYLPYVEEEMAVDYKGTKFVNLYNKFKQLDLNKIFTFKLEDRQADTLHPNQLGNAYIAKVILKEVWRIEFDPEKYMDETRRGEKLPRY
jgi:hypothetical protein